MGVRYIVEDVEAAVAFYTRHLGFHVVLGPLPGFAILESGDLRLLLNEPGAGSAGKAGAIARVAPAPGGWNRFSLEVDDLDDVIGRLHAEGVAFRGDVADGAGGRQILIEDPSGNPVELFEPARR